MLVEFEPVGRPGKIWINPAHVVMVETASKHETTIALTRVGEQPVKGSIHEVIEKLSTTGRKQPTLH